MILITITYFVEDVADDGGDVLGHRVGAAVGGDTSRGEQVLQHVARGPREGREGRPRPAVREMVSKMSSRKLHKVGFEGYVNVHPPLATYGIRATLELSTRYLESPPNEGVDVSAGDIGEGNWPRICGTGMGQW